MSELPPALPITPSPKRKRDALEPIDYSPPLSPPSRKLQTTQKELLDSPRSKVADGIRELNLEEKAVRIVEFGESTEKTTALSIGDAEKTYDAMLATRTLGIRPSPSKLQGPDQFFVASGTYSAFSEMGVQGLRIPTHSEPQLSDKRSVMKNKRPKSPPPTLHSGGGEVMAWTETEITSYDPNDPDDDGYGVNGIGFRPTAALAHQRSQKRQKQIAEWKSREAREARQKRMERRRGEQNVLQVENGPKRRKVRFDDAPEKS
ncbi:MAG: hypothetical protein M1834_006446 [Cirrosporium novae-zelandiae]|nr:MAG: hypothetical protein M1834_006446 [Cirrosporium novae-zelandiae]